MEDATPEFEAEESPQQFARRLKLPFRNMQLLTRALTHRSYRNEHPDVLEDNERLEFLGDAVLDFLVGAWLYNRYPEMAEGQLTRMRSSLVRTEQLAGFARELKIGRALRLGRGEAQAGSRSRTPLLCATFEALVGALYLQAGIDGVQAFMAPLLEQARQTASGSLDSRDPKSRLQEWSQSRGLGTPQYETVRTSGPDHDRTYEVRVMISSRELATGTGGSKQTAARHAAELAMAEIDEHEDQDI